MKRGDFAAAWRISDGVLASRDPLARDDPTLPYHERWVWAGQPPQGREVLVRCYHGLGDTLQFARYLPALRRQARSVTLEAQPALLELLATVGGADRLVAFVTDAPHPPSPCDVEIMELPHALRLAPATLPAPPYVHAPPTTRGGIGLCWQSGDWDPERSIPDTLIEPLVRACGQVAAVAPRPVQPAMPGRVFTLMPRPTTLPVHNPHGCPRAIADTAALIAGLDLVITVDSMVAHLAGALNRPTWLVLKHDADWRWMADRDDSPWYPSMRLYRQRRPHDWQEVLGRVTRDLKGPGSPAAPALPPGRSSPG